MTFQLSDEDKYQNLIELLFKLIEEQKETRKLLASLLKKNNK